MRSARERAFEFAAALHNLAVLRLADGREDEAAALWARARQVADDARREEIGRERSCAE